MASLEGMLVAAIAGRNRDLLTPAGAAGAIERVAALFGPNARTQNAALATAIARTGDKSSPEYRAAIRSVQRYRASEGRQRRTPAERVRPRLARAARVGITLPLRGGANVTITGEVQVSKDRRVRTLRARMGPELIGPTLGSFAAGDYGQATAYFLRDFRRAYSGVRVELGNITALTIRPIGAA